MAAVEAQRPGSPSRPSERPEPTVQRRPTPARLWPPWLPPRALGAKGSGWLRRGPWPPLTAGFCSGGPAGVGRPEPGSRPTSTRQLDGIRSAALRRAGLFPGKVAGGTREERGEEEAGPPAAPPHAEYSEARSVVSSARRGAQFIHHSGSVWRRGPTWRESADAAFTDVPCLGPVAFATLQDAHGGFKWGYLGELHGVFPTILIEFRERIMVVTGECYCRTSLLDGSEAGVFALQVMMLIQTHPVPIIAMVNGLATAAGCQLVASCDTAVASDKSSFATPGVNIGLLGSTPGVALGRGVPRKVALEMLFTREPVSAREALRHGLLSRVVPEERLEEETVRIARKVASPSRPVLSLGKAAFYRQLAQDLRTACHLTSQTLVDNLGLPDGQEGVKAFLQKRKPVWSH
ncbi:enoyl-CoA hydratase domain-containing protein 3, mitochondrial [Physeter macrocephalus]|uniref:Enoyl-CoA hydratase domain-containing protein 3, mitochondrial n=1 Tax=Physeter macrocephalus TaxID=9755 RepID=A0A9W2WZ65_PHYMC|nr:enoyl-CoA hydratase domain-containing protein 3, mitochondrial [Physeter catodon]